MATLRLRMQNHKEISHIVSKTNEGDITLLGLLTEGGQGLATGNNGDFVGCLEQTHEGNNVLLFGSEGYGLKYQTIKNSDFLLKIEINRRIESLNISNSAAVVFHFINNFCR